MQATVVLVIEKLIRVSLHLIIQWLYTVAYKISFK